MQFFNIKYNDIVVFYTLHQMQSHNVKERFITFSLQVVS